MFDDTARSADALKRPDLRATLERLHSETWRWALACCRGDAEAASEALQDSYLLLLEDRARHQGRSSFKTFLFGVVRMRARSARRRAALRDLALAPIEAAERIAEPPLQERSAQQRQIEAAMKGLSARQREVAELVLSHDLTVAEAAEVLGVSTGAASRHYALAKERLRQILNIGREDLD